MQPASDSERTSPSPAAPSGGGAAPGDAAPEQVAGNARKTNGRSHDDRGARRELLGLVLALAAGALVLGLLGFALRNRKAALLHQRRRAATARKPEAVPVVVQVLAPCTITYRIRLPGVVGAWVRSRVSAQVAGRVVDKPAPPLPDGARVKRGQVILHIDPADYRIARKQARAALDLARANFKRTRVLARKGVRTPADLDRDTSLLQRAEAAFSAAALALQRCEIRSPLTGVLDDVLPEVGEYVRAGDMVARVLELDRVKVEVGIPQADVNAVHRLVRTRGEVELDIDAAAPGRRLTGRAVYLSSAPRPDALVYTLRLEVDNRAGLLRPGMFVRANVVKARRRGCVRVPLAAVLPRGLEHFAYVVTPGVAQQPASGSQAAVAHERRVRLGVMQGREVEIVSGLRPGESLVVQGQQSLAEGSPVSVTRVVKSLAELER